MKTTLKLLSIGAALIASFAAQAQVAVVVGAKSPAAAMTAEQAAGLFLGKTDQVPGLGTALLLDLPEGSATREAFYTKVAGKSGSQVKAAWSRLVFSGKATPPKELSSSAEVKKMVAANANVVGYIEKSAVDASVKVLLSED